jgi:hypothetical protein
MLQILIYRRVALSVTLSPGDNIHHLPKGEALGFIGIWGKAPPLGELAP